MRYPDGFLDELRMAANIVSIVSGYVPLKRYGKSHKGLCPFHHEKTPSFNVDEAKGFFHCFGCGEGGDVFKFVMLFEKVGFAEAIQKVAALSGVPLPEVKPSDRGAEDRRQRLVELNEQALKLFRKVLQASAGAAARAYLGKRGVGAAAVETFEVGMTPEGWEGLSQALLRQGFSPAELVASGVAREREGGRGLYDRFHERLIFPIRNASGRLVGFGGRSLASQEPKYLNSPETEIYSKSEILYGLHLAKDQARKSERLVLVEGYLDLVALHQAGIQEVVASCGTALTSTQARLIARFARHVLVAYDGDVAGQNAAKKALKVLVPERLKVGIVALEPGEDPDDFVRARGAEVFRERMKGARDFLSFLASAVALGGERGAEGRLQLVNEALPVLALVDDPVERALLAARLSEQAGIEEKVLAEAIQKAAAEKRESLDPALGGALRARVEWSPAEAMVVKGLVAGLGTEEGGAGIGPEETVGLPSEAVLRRVLAARAAGEPVDAGVLLGELTGGDRDALGRALVDGPEDDEKGFRAALLTLRTERLGQELRRVHAAIVGATPEQLDHLLERKLELTRLLDHLSNSGDASRP